MSYKLKFSSYIRYPLQSSRVTIITSACCLLFFAFCFLPFTTQAQEISDEIFGEYVGTTEISIALLELTQTIPDVPILLVKTEDDYILKIGYLYIIEDVQLDNIIITPFEGGYKLSRTESINFTIPEITIPAFPPYFEEPQTFTDVPIVITLENSQIVDNVLTLALKAVATITYYLGPIPIPLPITVNINFEGMLFSPPVITTTELPNGTVGEAYYAILEADGIKPIAWSIFQGELPTGLQLDEQSGEITGMPTVENIFNFVVMATNTSGNEAALMSIEIEEEEQDTTGVATPAISLLKVYPNPTTGTLKIENGTLKIENVEIFDIYGRKQSPHHHIISSSHHEIDISHLADGLYFVKIKTSAGEIVKKTVKQPLLTD